MRVLHLIPGKIFGGIETTLVTRARFRHLAAEMVSEFAVCFEGRLSQELRSVGVPVHFLGNVRVSNPLTVWRARRRMRGLLRSRPFDVVFCHMEWTHAIFAPVARDAGVAVAYGIHHPISGTSWPDRWAARTRPDIAIALTHFLAREAEKIFPNVPVEVAYNPVVAPPSLNELERRAIRSQAGTPDDAVVIIQACRMQAGKGHRVCLEALAQLRDLPGWQCWQVGGPQRAAEQQYFETLRQHAAQLGLAHQVHFWGQRSDVARLLAAADIYCQPNDTFREGLGNVFVEAMRSGLPVVTSAIGAAPEIIDGACGFLLAPGDVDSLAATLEKLIHNADLRVKLGNGGRSRAASQFAPEVQIPRLYAGLAAAVSRNHISPNRNVWTAVNQ